MVFTVSERDREQGDEWMFILASNQLELSVLGYVPDASATRTAPARTSGGCQIHSLPHDIHPIPSEWIPSDCDDHHHNDVLQKKKDEKIARAKAQEAQNQGLTFKPQLNPRSIKLLKQVY